MISMIDPCIICNISDAEKAVCCGCPERLDWEREYNKYSENNKNKDKYLVITKYGQYQIEGTDFENAVFQTYNNNTGYEDVMAIIKIEN